MVGRGTYAVAIILFDEGGPATELGAIVGLTATPLIWRVESVCLCLELQCHEVKVYALL